ncbi:MAG: hypothetical protein PHE09_14905 [Oscillospiraceae bacterium]|nr:hypothetical protein [Oscillospiraceae bacterium]
MSELKKCKRCRYSHPFMGKNHDEYHCVLDGWEDDKVKIITEDVCEGCEKYSSRYIEYPLTIQGIEDHFSENCKHHLYGCGQLVKINPCGEEYGGKTYLGILLGDLPISTTVSFHHDDQKLHIGAMTNPAIFVPELKKIIYGCESWWGRIEKPEDMKDITSEDIENTWYVQLLKEMVKKEEPQNAADQNI